MSKYELVDDIVISPGPYPGNRAISMRSSNVRASNTCINQTVYVKEMDHFGSVSYCQVKNLRPRLLKFR
jgi:hypothetical protein